MNQSNGEEKTKGVGGNHPPLGSPRVKHIARLQRIQHAAARVVMNQHSRTSELSSSELLKQLHWLSIEWRIRFKLATLTFKALRTGYPTYLSNLLQHHEPVRSLRSSSSHYLSVPRHNLKFGSRAFRSFAPRVWNSLPISIRESQSLPTSRRHIKTFCFQSAYPLQLSILPRIYSSTRPDSS